MDKLDELKRNLEKLNNELQRLQNNKVVIDKRIAEVENGNDTILLDEKLDNLNKLLQDIKILERKKKSNLRSSIMYSIFSITNLLCVVWLCLTSPSSEGLVFVNFILWIYYGVDAYINYDEYLKNTSLLENNSLDEIKKEIIENEKEKALCQERKKSLKKIGMEIDLEIETITKSIEQYNIMINKIISGYLSVMEASKENNLELDLKEEEPLEKGIQKKKVDLSKK